MTNRGRKTILTKEETQNIVDAFIVKYEKINNIRSIDIHRYCELLYLEGKLSKLPQESFWRKKDRQGRKIIDETNDLLSKNLSLEISEQNYNQFMKILKKDNISTSNLNMISKELTSHFKTINIKDDYINSLILNNKRLENEKLELLSTNNAYHELLTNVYHFLLRRNTNTSADIFENAFNNIFSNPISYVKKTEASKEDSNSVSSIFKKKLNNI